MKKSKAISLILSLILLLSSLISVSAKEINTTNTSSYFDKGIVAGNYEVVESTKLTPTFSLPSYYNSNDEGYTTPVRSQSGSTCWCFGSLATLESFMLKQKPNSPITNEWFSPMHMAAWGTKHNNYGWERSYLSGGYPYISLGYLTSWSGARLESDYNIDVPYEDYESMDANTKPYEAVTQAIYLDTNDPTTIKTAIYTYGATIGNYHENGSYRNPETSAYYNNQPNLSTSQLNGHCISIVGWDDNYSRENFLESHRPNNDGAWICKNSWGPGNGINGYFYISYEDYYLFSTKFGYSYAITEVRDMTSSSMIYQNEIYGATYDFDYLMSTSEGGYKGKTYDEITYANVFDIKNGFKRIESIEFESESIGSQYSIYLIPIEKNLPSSDESTWQLLKNGTISYSGYHNIKLNSCLLNEGKIAIGIKIKSVNDSGICIGCDEWLTSGGKYLFKPETKQGDSYIIGLEDKAIDLLEYYSTQLGDEIGSTFVIKAIASQEHPFGDVNRDYDFTISDCTHLQQHLAKLFDFNNEQELIGDTNYDGEISILDATTMQKMFAKLMPIPNQ